MHAPTDFRQALDLHRSGHLQQAESLYQRVLRRNPKHADALHLLGLIASEAGHYDAAANLIASAIRIRGPEALYCANLGLVFSRQDKPDQAIACFRQSLQKNPNDAAVLFRMGECLARTGKIPEAIDALRRSARLQPDAATWLELGNLLYAAQQLDEAAEAYQSAIGCGGRDPRCQFNLGVIRTMQKRVAEAEESYRGALQCVPDYPEAHNNLAILRQAAGDVPDACEHYILAIHGATPFPRARYNYASLLHDSGALDEACREYGIFLTQEPENHYGHNGLGITLKALGRPWEALAEFEQALRCNPEFVQARFNRGIAHLLLGNYRQGWSDYEWRFQQPGQTPRKFSIDRWDGRPLKGEKLLLWAEQGLGDALQFIRYLPLVLERGAAVLLECRRPLVDLLGRLPGIDLIVTPEDPSPPADLYCPLLSLPRIFGTDLDNIPGTKPYLLRDPGLREKWRQHLERTTPAGLLRVGLCWTGNSLNRNGRNRAVDPVLLNPLANIPGVVYFNLQHQADRLPDIPFSPLLETLDGFDTTAALISNLDLVITADTVTAHLAGGLGQKVWILLPYAADWRWLTEREDSPWYPTARLFRQPNLNDWPPVIERIRNELSNWEPEKKKSH